MKAKLVKKIIEAKGTTSFYFEPEKKVSWLPGQYFYFTLPKLDFPDTRGATRHFTISSSPTESKLLRLTTRLRQESGYKKTLDALPLGSVVDIEGPNGTLILDEQENSAKHILLAGGIGITPFRAFIKHSIDRKLQIPMYLIYSNGSSDFAFKKDLEKWDKDNEFIKVNFFDTSKSGHLDAVILQKLIPDSKFQIPNSTFWLVGPPPFIDAM